jgi:murein DD-endopeptidase MepM/ murein hydrolase activator NlpD
MNVSIFISGKKHIRHIQLGKLSLLVLASLSVLAVYHMVKRQSYQGLHFLQSHYEKHQQEEKINQYKQLKDLTQSQIAVIATKIAYIEARISNMEALSKQLAKRAKLSASYNTSKSVAQVNAKKTENNVDLLQLLTQIDNIIIQLENDYKSLTYIDAIIRKKSTEDKRYISGRPVKKGWLSSPYGIRKDPFSGRQTMHKGIDFAGAPGAPVISTGAGLVVWADEMFGYGKLVEVDHGNGYRTRYGHNKKITVTVGDIVVKGQEVARIGSTGRSTGPHVHYEVWRNKRQVDPSRYVYRLPR